MLSFLREKFAGIQKIAGLEVFFDADGVAVFNLVILEFKKGIVSVIFNEKNSKITEQKELLSGLPVVVSFTGKGILIKKLEGALPDDILANVLPNANAEDFLYSTLPGEKTSFVFLGRKDKLQSTLQQLNAQGLVVIDFVMGPSAVSSVVPLVKLSKSILPAGNYQIRSEGKEVYSILSIEELINEELIIGNEKVDSSVFIAFCSALNFLINKPESVHPVTSSVFEEWKEKQLFHLISKAALALIGFFLFLNLFLFFQWTGKNEKLNSEISYVLSDIKKLETLEENVQEKEEFLKDAGWVNASRASYYSDQVALTVPSTVLLTSLTINKLDEEESRKQKRMVFNNGKIFISGRCSDPVVLNPWINELKKSEWVKDASNRKYQYDPKEKSGYFEIELVVDGDI